MNNQSNKIPLQLDQQAQTDPGPQSFASQRGIYQGQAVAKPGSIPVQRDANPLHTSTEGSDVVLDPNQLSNRRVRRTQRRPSPYCGLPAPGTQPKRNDIRRNDDMSSDRPGALAQGPSYSVDSQRSFQSNFESSQSHTPAVTSGASEAFVSTRSIPEPPKKRAKKKSKKKVSRENALPTKSSRQSMTNFDDLRADTRQPATLNGSVALYPSSSQTEAGSHTYAGTLAGAQGIVMHQPTFIDHKTEGSTTQLLKWLQESIMEGAEHDSWQRDPPPRCHPETRTNILQRANDWIDNPHREKKILWVCGPAGVGKSAIVQTLAESLSASGRLGATIFFSRPNGRADPQKVFPTLAYQLATRDPSYKAYVNDLMVTDSRPLEVKAMREQFRLLIVEPFSRRGLRSGQTDLLMAIDGLDECYGDGVDDDPSPTRHRGRALEEVQREIIQLISAFVQNHPSVPLIWIIASRPETHLKATFFADGVKDSYVEEDIPIDSTEACEDVEKFLHSSFTEIREKYPDHIEEPLWPSHEHFLQISRAARGLFVFAQVVIRFIEDTRVGNPVAQLGYVLAAISKSHKSSQSAHPLIILDAVYTAILDRIPRNVIDDTKRLLQVVIHCHRQNIQVSDFTFGDIRNYLNISKPDASSALRHLHSVISFPRVKDIDATRPRLYHASFGDYLEDPSRSDAHAIGKWQIDGERVGETYFLNGIDRLVKKINDAKKEVFQYVLTPILQWDPRRSSGISIKILGTTCTVPSVTLLSLLESLKFKQMLLSPGGLTNASENLPLHKENEICVDWLKERGILSITTLHSLGEIPSEEFWVTEGGRFQVLCDFQRQGWSGAVANLSNKHRANLRRLASEAPKTKILVWGYRGGEQCAVIQECDLPSWWFGWRNGSEGPVYIVGF